MNPLLKALANIPDTQLPPEDLLAQITQAFLDIASETPDNLACAKELSMIHKDRLALSLDKENPLSDIIYYMEGADIPEQLQEALPRLTQAQWDAALRLITVILISFEKNLENTSS